MDLAYVGLYLFRKATFRHLLSAGYSEPSYEHVFDRGNYNGLLNGNLLYLITTFLLGHLFESFFTESEGLTSSHHVVLVSYIRVVIHEVKGRRTYRK